jgi:glycosyltransferase involved in cell wall biosynthesis
MKREFPQVSIGLPVYNGERFLDAALKSLLGQTFGNFELLVSDNASTDATEEICESYAAQDRRVIYHRNKTNVGIARNYSGVVGMTCAPYFKWHAHDDVLAPEFIARCVEVLDNDPSVVLVTSRPRLIDANGTHGDFDTVLREFMVSQERRYVPAKMGHQLSSFRPGNRFGDVVRNTFTHHIYGLIRRNVLEKTSLHGPYFGADKVMLAELALLGRFYEIDEPLFSTRIHNHHPTNPRSVELALRIDPSWHGWVHFPEARMVVEYLRVVRRADLSFGEKLRCVSMIARKVLKPEYISRVVGPGPNNVFGINFRKHSSSGVE